MSLCISVCVHAVTCVHPCVTVHVIVYVHVYVYTCCWVDLRLLCVSTGGLSVVFVHVQYVLFVVACSSSLLTLCTCTLLVYRICMSVCLFVSPWTSRLATALECIMPTSVWMNRDCDCECSTVYVCLLYMFVLCTLILLLVLSCCSVVYLDYLCDSYCCLSRVLVTYSGNTRLVAFRSCCLEAVHS